MSNPMDSMVDMGYSGYGVAQAASNIKDGDNPDYILSDFYSAYPAFAPRGASPDVTYIVPEVIIQMYLDLAHASIKEARWNNYWKMAMGLFVAHFVTLYLQSVADATSTAAQVIAAGQAKGLTISESAGDVSYSQDINTIAQDLDGWAAWKLTAFGQQLATFGKLVGKGGMYIR
jgi:hypothetical protein